MYEDLVRDCVFGYTEEGDYFQHYLSCWRLRRFLRESPHVYVSPAEWLCLENPTRERALLLVTAFLAYHAIKNDTALNFSREHELQLIFDAARSQALASAPPSERL